MWLNSHFMTSDPRRRNGRYKEENRRHSAVFSPHLYTSSDLTTRGRLKSTFVFIRGHRWAEKSAHHKLAHRAPSRSFMFLNCRVLLLWRHPFPPLLSPESTRRCFRQSCEGERGEMTHTHADTHTLTHTHSQSSQRWKWPPTVKTFRLLSSAPQRRVGLSVCQPHALVKQ